MLVKNRQMFPAMMEETDNMGDDPTNQHLADISVKMDRVAKLLALNLVKDMKKQKEQIAFLSDAGFQPKEIADILSTSSGNVRVTLHSIRKERGSTEEEEQGHSDEKPAMEAEASDKQ